MTNTNTNIALIPARAGSKRLPGKNVKLFSGKPMICWTIEAAQQSQLFDSIVVSTDDEEIATLAGNYGATVLMRPENVSDDNATLLDVLQHAINSGYNKHDNYCLLLANCPLRNHQDICSSFKQFTATTPPALLSVVDYGWTPAFRGQYIEDHVLTPIYKKHYTKKGQNFPDSVCPSGAIYWSTADQLIKADNLYIKGIQGFKMPWHRAIDIDTAEDFELASFIYDGLKSGLQLGGENVN